MRKKIKIVRGDIRDKRALGRSAKNTDVIFHLAAIVPMDRFLSNPPEAADINVMGTVNVLDAAREAKCKRVVYISSCAVYGDDPVIPKKESMAIEPISFYAESKRMNERHAFLFHKYFGLDSAGLRVFNAFGPRQDASSPYSGVISIFLDKFSKNKRPTIFGDGGNVRDFVFVKDIVRAIVLAGTFPKPLGAQVFNVAGGRGITLLELVNIFNRVFKTNLKPIHAKARPWDVRYSVADIGRIRRVLSFVPRYTLAKALESTRFL